MPLVAVRRLLILVAAAVVALTAPGTARAAGSGWSALASMQAERRAHETVELADGRLLAISGFSNALGEVPVAELYDPSAGTWSLAAPPLVPRHYATATLLADGTVLLAGGSTGSGVTTHAELYDPRHNTWTATGAMAHPRNGHSATLLADGTVLVVGGADGARNAQPHAERYHPSTGTWSPAGSLRAGAENLALQALPDGRVLAAGGFALAPSTTFRAAAEVYDPSTGAWTPTGDLTTPRGQAGVARLIDGRVAVIGGLNSGGFRRSIEVWSPATGAWTAVAGIQPPTGNVTRAVTLADGTVLIVSDGGAPQLWDPAAGTLTAEPFAFAVPSLPSVTLLRSGGVLVAGGGAGTTARTVQRYTPRASRTAPVTDFGTLAPGTSAEREIEITNPGPVPLQITAVTLAGDGAAAFTIVNSGCAAASPLAQGQACTVRVRFTAAGPGEYAAELRFDDNAETAPAPLLRGSAAVPVVMPDPPAGDPPTPPAPQPAPPAPPAGTPRCTDDYVVLAGVQGTGGARAPKMRLTGIASASLAGRRLTVQRDGRRVGSVTPGADGSFAVTVAAPKRRSARAGARYRVLRPGVAQSLALKATRVASVAVRRPAAGGARTATGRIAGLRRRATLTVEARPSCGPGAVVKRIVRTDRRGRFRATLAPPAAGSPALIYRIRMGAKTVTLPIVVAARG